MSRIPRGLVPASLLLCGACAGGLPPMPMPVGLAPAAVSEAERWAASTRPGNNRDLRFRWQFQDERGAVGGRGRVRLAVPDSVRFDLAGPLGSGRAAAFVTGDTAVWAEPRKDVEKLVPDYPLFWAMLGIARAPDPDSRVRTRADPGVTAWQFISGGDTVEYVRERGRAERLIAEVRRAGKRIGRVETRFGPDGLPLSSRLVVSGPPARLDLTFYLNSKAESFGADTWIRPAPAER
ncbi:MAG TPA: hypothetical protein VGQ17_02235 [Gemmatimonadales bacterium]|nr:hypothetical protein [Gemmatimonadales bacterium]